MGLKLSSIRNTAPEDGAWQEVKEWGVDPVTKKFVRLKVRPIGNRDYQIARELLTQKLTKNLGRPPTSPEMEPELGALIAQYLLCGWEGLDGDDKAPVDWSMETGIQYLTDPEYRTLETQTILASMRVGECDAEFTAAAIKNSAVPSATT